MGKLQSRKDEMSGEQPPAIAGGARYKASLAPSKLGGGVGQLTPRFSLMVWKACCGQTRHSERHRLG